MATLTAVIDAFIASREHDRATPGRRVFGVRRSWNPDPKHRAALGYGQLGMMARDQRDDEAAGAWTLKAIGGFFSTSQQHCPQNSSARAR